MRRFITRARGRSGFAPAVSALALGLLALAPTSAAAGVRPLTTGFTDPVYADPALQGPYLDRTVSSGAGVVLATGTWGAIAARRPANPTDPGDPAYDWSGLDAGVRAIAARGLAVAVDLTSAPAWAEGPLRPKKAAAGSWRPGAAAFGEFAQAAATRYSGSFTDPADPGRFLPRVRYWQAWAEPNLDLNLTPQWVRRGRRYTPTSPSIYRGLLDAFYAGVKRASARAVVVTAGTAPFGDPPGGTRIAPVRFDRELLCLPVAGERPQPCARPPRFDVLAHHPYAVGSPLDAALNPEDVSVPDLRKLGALLSEARHRYRLAAAHKRLWVTEFSYDSSPPDPRGVPVARHARWLEQALYVFWRQGVDTVIWYRIRDQAPIPDYASTYQSGVYTLDGRPKPAQRAFRFPFVTERTSHNSLRAWGRSPVAGSVAIQIRAGAGWQTLARRSVGRHGVFYVRVDVRGPARLRATVSGQSSLAFDQP